MLCLLFIAATVSCCKDEEKNVQPNKKTLFIYMPWSSNLTNYFYTNLTDMEQAIKKTGLANERVIVFFSSSSTEASMFEITYENGATKRTTLKTYAYPAFTTEAGITSILNDMKGFAPAQTYDMVIGCHGMGWLPVNSTRTSRAASLQKHHWEYENVPTTRYFGGTSSLYQTDISTLASALKNAGIKMEYILFDDCYMSDVEVAYELRNVTAYLIACPTEIMSYGMPYSLIGEHLLGTPDYQAICDKFYSFYSTYTVPCGTMGITDCSQMEKMASVMKEINSKYKFDTTLTDQIQRLDGYSPVIFFDYEDYVTHLCKDEQLLARFKQQLALTVPYKTHTPQYYSMNRGRETIRVFSGTTISDPSTNSWAVDKTRTGWYLATH